MTRQEELDFCQFIWDGLNDGGIWGIPRSELFLMKDELAKQFVVNEIPNSQAETEFYGLKERYAEIGIEVVLREA